MQTDPNFSNFLYSPRGRCIQLIDFGATREYSQEFMDDWLRLLLAAVRGDEEECKRWSLKVGYLLVDESGACLDSDQMVQSHIASMVLLGVPFRSGGKVRYDFATHAALTDEIKSHIPHMLKERKTPPPKETYSLNRKLSGTFLLCARLKARVDCSGILRQVVDGYKFNDGSTAHFDADRGWTILPSKQVQLPLRCKSSSTQTTETLISACASRGFHTSARRRDERTHREHRKRQSE